MRSERSRIATAAAGLTSLLAVMLAIRPVSVQQILTAYVLLLAVLGPLLARWMGALQPPTPS